MVMFHSYVNVYQRAPFPHIPTGGWFIPPSRHGRWLAEAGEAFRELAVQPIFLALPEMSWKMVMAGWWFFPTPSWKMMDWKSAGMIIPFPTEWKNKIYVPNQQPNGIVISQVNQIFIKLWYTVYPWFTMKWTIEWFHDGKTLRVFTEISPWDLNGRIVGLSLGNQRISWE